MAYRNLAKKSERFSGPTAPRKRYISSQQEHQTLLKTTQTNINSSGSHPLTNLVLNKHLQAYEVEVKGIFDRIVPLLKRLSELQHHQELRLMQIGNKIFHSRQVL